MGKKVVKLVVNQVVGAVVVAVEDTLVQVATSDLKERLQLEARKRGADVVSTRESD